MSLSVPKAESPAARSPALALGLTLGALVLAGLFAATLVHRVRLHKQVVLETREMALPSVTVLHPKIDRSDLTLELPGSVMPYYDAPIYARTNGYLKKWYVDIGTEVKEGQLLAEIETPEIDQQLNQAYAEREQAKANLALARTTAARWKDLLQKNAVAQQDVDEKLGSLASQQAALNAAAAEVHRLENLQSFKNIVAPFNGIVTNRNTDVGDLINSGGASGGQPLFRVAQIGKLRIYVNVPEVDSSLIAIGNTATITLASAPGRPAVGKVTSTAKAIDPTSRTLLTEIQIANPGGLLLPGSYAQVTFHLAGGRPPLVIPINTILFRPGGPEVGLVDPQGRVTLRAIEIGRNLGTTVEVLTGLKADDTLILNPSDSLATGAQVRIVP
jgi:RND family efflux transporter MFP subunit